jgi:hypothetical protein
MKQTLVNQRLLAVFLAGGLLFNFPLLALWDPTLRWWGLPVFPTALFGLWAVLIACLVWIMERVPD